MSEPWFKQCPICREGVLLAMKTSAGMLLICDDCDSAFRNLDDLALVQAPADLQAATSEDIDAAGWKPMGYL